MVSPAGHIRMSRADRREIERRVPFPVSILGDRDDAFWRLFHCAAEEGDRRLYTFKPGIVLWVAIRDEMVVKVKVFEGRRAQRELENHAYFLPPDYADRILSALKVGRDGGEGLREVFGDKLIPLQDLGETSRGDHRIYWFLVRNHWPEHRAALELELDSRGLIAGVDLHQGQRATRVFESFRRCK